MSKRIVFYVLVLLMATWAASGEENPGQVVFLMFKTQADLPQFDTFGNGIPITDAKLPHGGIYSAGVQLRNTTETHNRERWTVEWRDPSGNLSASSQLNYIGIQPNGNDYCWQGFCGIGVQSTWTVFTSFFTPNCSMKVGDKWKWRLLWQYSDIIEADPNADFTAPVVAQEQEFTISPSLGALQLSSGSTIVHPASETSTGGSTYTTFPGGVAHIKATALDCGKAPPNPVTVTFTVNVVPQSGGHNHAAPPLARVTTFDSMTCQTDKTGVCTVTMTGGGASSLLKVKAHIDDFDTSDTAVTPVNSEEFHMAVAIAGLEPMTFDNSFVYASGATAIHPDNHYAQPEMIAFINLFAKNYADNHGGERIRIDDMSLPLGGVFDLNSSYASPQHAFHRFGVDVDVSRHIVDSGGTTVTNGLDEQDLTDYITNFLGGKRYPEGPIHYRFPQDGIDQIISTRINP